MKGDARLISPAAEARQVRRGQFLGLENGLRYAGEAVNGGAVLGGGGTVICKTKIYRQVWLMDMTVNPSSDD